MDSSPTNDALAYLTLPDVAGYLDQIAELDLPVQEIAFTGGEPFMNRDLPSMLGSALERGYRVLVLTNAMKPLLNKRPAPRGPGPALCCPALDPSRLHGSLHAGQARGHPGRGLVEAHARGAQVAGRERLLAWPSPGAPAGGRARATPAPATPGCSPTRTSPWTPMTRAVMVLFPEMDETADVPEITVSCWDILGVAPETMMCATSRMVIKRKGAVSPVVVPCTPVALRPPVRNGPRPRRRGPAGQAQPSPLRHLLRAWRRVVHPPSMSADVDGVLDLGPPGGVRR